MSSMFQNYVIFRQDERKKEETYLVGAGTLLVTTDDVAEAEHYPTAREAYSDAERMSARFPALLDWKVGLR